MNHIYRLCWNRSLSQWVPASELARTTQAGGGSRKRGVTGLRVLARSLLAMSLSMAGLAHAGTAPVGGQIVAGSGQIQQTGNVTTIRQDSSTLMLNWQSFNIAADQTVNFLQPGSSAIAVNRIFSNTPSEIYGHLNANGQVWLINPNGILFGQSAQVNVGGLVASTLDFDSSTLDASDRRFSGSGKGSIVNRGTITAANGGYVALLGNQVSNQGTVTAQLGTVALAGGSSVTLTFAGSQLVHLQVDQSTLNNLAENRQLIVADGGRVIMTAGAKDALLASVVKNTGVVQAQTVQNHNGTITLLGGMTAGQVDVGGTLDASAPNGGSGGSIETSAANFNLASDARITAAAPHGKAGTWLVDPTDLIIDTTAANTISSTLQSGTSVTETTSQNGASGTGTQTSGTTIPGDIIVNAGVSWTNAAATFTLQAYNGIQVNAPVSGSGKVVMQAAGTFNGAGISIASGGSIKGGAGVTLASATNFVNNAGSAAISTGTTAPWLIYSTNPTLDTTDGLTPNFIQYNASYQTAAAASGNGFLYSVAPKLTVTGLSGSASKSYDGTTTATLSASNLSDSGLIAGDTIASATGTYQSANAGSNIAVATPTAISGYTITTSAGIPVYGYSLSGAATANIGTINPAILTATIVGDPTKVYDGTTTATLGSSNYQLTGFAAGQGATVNQPSSVAYVGADAGSQQVNAAFTSTNFVANAGTNFSNYVLPTSAIGMGTITQAPVLLSGLLANNKIYDGTIGDALNLSNVGIYGVISQDSSDVTLSTVGGTGSFASANAGNNIGVSVTGFSLTGSKANDYQLIAPTNLTANITPKALTVSGVTATNKVYDGTATDTLNMGSATLNGVVSGDGVSLLTGSATGTFGQSDVGSSLAVTASGLSLTGSAAGNYTLTDPAGLTANILARPLTVSFNGSPAKTYDGTDAATLTQGDFTITGFVGTQNATVSQSPAIYASSNAGTNIGVTATLQPSDFTPGSGTSLSNYTFNSSVTGTGTINPAPLIVSIINNPTKTYDGGNAATLDPTNSYALSGLVGGDSINLANLPTTGTYAGSDVGTWQITAALSGSNFNAAAGTLLSNYALPTLASGYGSITPASIGVSIIASLKNPVTKVYDGSTQLTLPSSDFNLAGFQGTDSAYINQSIFGYYATQNVGTNLPFQVTLSSADFTFTSGLAKDYSFPTYIFTTGNITPAALTVSLIGNLNKVYDGSTVAQLTSSNFQINGFVNGEGATVTPTTSFNYATANAGNNIAIGGTLTANNYLGTGSTLLSNYTLPTTVSGFGNIAKAPLYITGVYATNKVYDTNADDTLNVASAGLAGLVASDVNDVTLGRSTSGTFAQSNVGTGIAVTANGFSISGNAAANYNLQPISGLIANITPAPLTINGVTAADKVYNGTTGDTLNTGSAALQGVLGSDNVTVDASGAGGTFSTSNVGSNLAVSADGFILGGAQAGNYMLAQPSGLTANITPAQLTAVITGSPTKVYDGTNSATLTASDYTLTGFVSGQGASIPQSATANYVTPNAGTSLGVQSTLVVSDFVAGAGTLLSNYILPTSASGTNGVITPLVLNLSGTRVYDASTDGMGNLFGTLTGLNGDTFILSGQGSSSSKNVGTYTGTGSTSGSQPFNLGSLALVANGSTGSGADLTGNYTLIGGTDTLVITPATLSVTGTTVNPKTYDGNTSATLGGTQLVQGVLGSDNVTIASDVGNFASPNAGTNIAVTSAITLGGADAGNYILTQPSGLTGTINQAVINLSGTRQYDANTDANFSAFGNNGVIGTGVDGETLKVTGLGSVTSANVGSYTGANFNTGTLTLTNGTGLASNYTLAGGTDTFAITPYVLSLTGTRQYDTTTAADASLFGNSGVLTGVNGEALTLGGSGAVSNKNVGTYKGTGSTTGSQPFNLSTLQLGSGTGLVSNYTLIGGKDTLTITQAPLTVTGTTVDPKTYDGTTNATLGGTQQLQGVLGSDDVTIASDVGSFASPNAGTNIAVASAITLGGTDAGNYKFTQPSGLTGTINQAVINLNGTRQYDANTDANASAFGNNGLINTGVNGEVLTLTGAGTVTGANVGSYTGANFNAGTLALTNGTGLASNYTLAGGADTLAITPYVLNLTSTRVYDGTTGANASLFGNNGALTGVNGETLTLGGSGVLSTKNVGQQQSFAGNGLAGFTLTGNGSTLASNYTLTGGTDWVTITPYVLSLNGSRAYDGSTGANASLFGNSGVLTGVNGETLTLNGSGTVSSANASANPYTGTGSSTSTSQGFNLNTLALTGNGSADASNYTLIGGADALTINRAVINLSGSRQYDANTDANASAFGNNGVIGTGVNGETLTLIGAGAVTGANVGGYTGANFNAGTLALNNGTGSAGNYTLVGGSDNLTITPYVLSLSGTREYNGTTGANASLFGNNGALTGVNGETLTLSGSGTVSSVNASVNPYTGIGSNTSTSQGFNLNALTLAGNGSAQASNYTLIGGTDTLTISQAVISLSSSRAYDGTTGANASLFGNNGTISTGVNGETLTLTGAGTVTGANVGSYTGANFNASTLALSNGAGSASNYTLAGGSDTLAITPYVLNLTGARVYDGTTGANASLFGNNGVLTGVSGETLTLGGAGVLSTKNVGQQLSFASNGLNGFALNGNGSALAGNYTLAGGTDWVTITPLAITVSATGQSKTYDGNTTAGVSLGSNGVLTGDTVSFSDGAANFSSPNAGSSVSIAVTGITASGADVGDYSFNTTASTSAAINPYVLSLTGTRVYDGTTGANASLFGSDGVLTGLNGQTVTVSGSGVLSSKNVGTQRAFANLGSLVLGNGTGLAGNYTLVGGTDWATITPATLMVIGTTTTNRVYDGTTIDTLNGSTLGGIFGNDNVVLGNDGAGQFGDKNVGNGKAVSTAMTISGTDASNYILVQPNGLIANITPLPIVVNATGTNRVYNGQVGDVVSLTADGVLPGDALSFTDSSATFANPYVGNGKTVTVYGITAVGTDAANYLITDPITTTTANITSAGFAGSGVQGSWIAQLQGGLRSMPIATPYGSTDMDTVGVYTGNQKLRHRPIERNRARSDFRSGLALKLQNGGVRLPTDASP